MAIPCPAQFGQRYLRQGCYLNFGVGVIQDGSPVTPGRPDCFRRPNARRSGPAALTSATRKRMICSDFSKMPVLRIWLLVIIFSAGSYDFQQIVTVIKLRIEEWHNRVP
jgi:hypothetical protein